MQYPTYHGREGLISSLATSKPVMNKMTTMGNHRMRSHVLGVKM